jgi:xylose isomerase
VNTHWKNKKATLDKEEKALEAMEQQVGEADGLVAAKLAEMKECEAGLKEVAAALAEKDAALQEKEAQYQAMSAGISQQEGEGGEEAATLTDLIASSSQAAQAAEGDAAQCA